MSDFELKIRVCGIDFADALSSAFDIDSAIWTAQPVTLRDDELSIIDKDPDEFEVYSHEKDSSEEYELDGVGLLGKGTFINATREQLCSLLGGEILTTVNATYFTRKYTRLVINNAVRFRLIDGGSLVFLRARGYVLFNTDFESVAKFPFVLNSMDDLIICSEGTLSALRLSEDGEVRITELGDDRIIN